MGGLAVVVSAALAVGLLPGVASAAPARGPADRAEEAAPEPEPGARSEAEAFAAARKSGESVEIPSMRGESREVFATPSGDLEAREYLRPVWTRVDGQWKAVDTDLATVPGGLVAPKATTVGLAFSGGGDAPLVRMEKAGRELALTWPGALPAPELDGSMATYRNVLPDVDLRMGAQEDGFTQLLVVKTAEAARSSALKELRLKLGTEGVEVREASEGGLEAVDKGAGSAVFEAPKPMMWDSSPGEGAPAARAAKAADAERDGERDGEPGAGESGKLAPVDVTLPAGGDELVLTPDQDVLVGGDTHYPVFIDPQWYSPRASAWTMASKYWASSPQWKFNGENNAGVGYCGWDYCAPHDTKRLFYRIPTSKFAGKSILSAEFVVRNVHSASCTARGVQLWRTKDISSSTTWNSQNASGFWIDHLKTESFAYGYTGCASKDAEFDVRSAVQQAANGKWSTMTFGLQASSESDRLGWKRFSDKAYLRVKYNRPPAQVKMSQLSMEYGGTCKNPGSAARVRTLGKIYANKITDPDGDNVALEFQAKWDAGDGKGLIVRWKPARTSAKKSGSNFSISLPSVPQNKTAHWYVRAWDGAQYSPWSTAGDPTACYFVYDASVPRAPAITSGEYPASNPENPDDPWWDGVGKYGNFSVKAADNDVTKYWYGINGDPTSKNTLTTTGGAAKVARILPAEPGVNFITAQAFDAAGNGSEVRTYQFRVKAGQPDRATWQLDEPAGATAGQGSTPPRTLTLNGGAVPGAAGVKGTAVHFNGTDGYASTDLSPVDTSRGFAVSAWVKLDRKTSSAADVVVIPGNNAPGLELYYSATHGWSFNQYKSDDINGGLVRVAQGDTSKVTVGAWTHLVGSYNSAADLLELYVDGLLVGSVPYATPWEARRGLQIGGRNISGTPSYLFPGTIDEVQLFDKPLTRSEVDKLKVHQSIGDPGRPAIGIFPLDEPADATEIAGQGGVLPAAYHGGVTPGQTGVKGKATKFNGTNGYARIGQASGPHVNTSRSFTVSAWAKLDRKPTSAGIITAQAGQQRPGFELYYSSTYDRWAFNQYASDSADAKIIRAMQADGVTARLGEWVHLVGVHDTVAETLTLYVNGTKAGATKLSGAFYADQSMYIGASNHSGAVGNFFPGTIDEVRLFDRPVSDEEVLQMFRQRPLVKARWKLDEAGTTTPATSPDDAGTAGALTLGGAAKIGWGFMDAGLELDGVSGYASTPTVPVDTGTSFTVTGWAQAAAAPEDEVAVVSAEGTTQSAFALKFVPDAKDPAGPGRWQVDLPSADTASPSVEKVANGEFYDVMEWNHLALVYDGFAKQARLYVNGSLQEIACSDANGDGDADETGCEDLISWAEDTLTFKAGKSLQIGRAKQDGSWGGYFPGAVDDVWAFQGALNDTQIEYLASAWFDVPTEVPVD
ncbi:LamG-like jellyroll fold domain-containing protein [Streptomyces sp. CFMR 7]|uniref:LamG-like jellyroll fold domain-containing protein n=1 Tax=Streptomyces sp. CFMR 7 TaxID=1649184 RepID=UPI000A5498F8|nr:LamG-like jellyroll fold domain-containing protein [Streptomyces sp. CFMR 7]